MIRYGSRKVHESMVDKGTSLKRFFVENGWAIGFAEVRRAVVSKQVLVNGRVQEDADLVLKNGDVVKFGKRKKRFQIQTNGKTRYTER